MQRNKGYMGDQGPDLIPAETFNEIHTLLNKAEDNLLQIERFEGDFTNQTELRDLPFLVRKILRDVHARLQNYDSSDALDQLFKDYLRLKLRLQNFIFPPADNLTEKTSQVDFARIIAESLLTGLDVQPELTQDLDTPSFLRRRLTGEQFTIEQAREDDIPDLYKINIAHPLKFARGNSSPLCVIIHPEDLGIPEERYKTALDEQIGAVKSHLPATSVQVQLRSLAFDFSGPAAGEWLDVPRDEPLVLDFVAQPKAQTQPGEQAISLVVLDQLTGQIIFLRGFRVEVVDFIFLNISRPFFTRITAAFSGLMGVAMFILTLLELLDKTAGLTAGTGGILLAGALLGTNYVEYRRTLEKELRQSP